MRVYRITFFNWNGLVGAENGPRPHHTEPVVLPYAQRGKKDKKHRRTNTTIKPTSNSFEFMRGKLGLRRGRQKDLFKTSKSDEKEQTVSTQQREHDTNTGLSTQQPTESRHFFLLHVRQIKRHRLIVVWGWESWFLFEETVSFIVLVLWLMINYFCLLNRCASYLKQMSQWHIDQLMLVHLVHFSPL